MTRLCHTKSIVTVNGEFPGPRIVAREGDRLLIKVTNHVPNNISIHWYFNKYILVHIYDFRINIKEIWWNCVILLKQAWNPTNSKWLGRWTGIHNTVPHTNRPELCVQLHHCWAKGNSILACTYIMAKINPLWSYYHTPQEKRALPICQTIQGSSDCLW